MVEIPTQNNPNIKTGSDARSHQNPLCCLSFEPAQPPQTLHELSNPIFFGIFPFQLVWFCFCQIRTTYEHVGSQHSTFVVFPPRKEGFWLSFFNGLPVDSWDMTSFHDNSFGCLRKAVISKHKTNFDSFKIHAVLFRFDTRLLITIAA